MQTIHVYFLMIQVHPSSAVEVKKSRHLMRDLELLLFIDCFPEMYPENEVATSVPSTLKGALDRKVGGG